MMLAGPMPTAQSALPGMGRVEGGVTGDQQAAQAVDIRLGFAPERKWVGFEALQQSGEGVMRGATWLIRLDARRFATRDHPWCGHEKVDVIEIRDFGCIHRRMIPHNPSTA